MYDVTESPRRDGAGLSVHICSVAYWTHGAHMTAYKVVEKLVSVIALTTAVAVGVGATERHTLLPPGLLA